MEGITFDDISLEDLGAGDGSYLIVNNVRGRGVMPSYVNSVQIPGRAGSYFEGTNKGERIIEVDLTIKGTSFTDLRDRIDALSDALYAKEPAPLMFDDEPDKVYYAVMEDVSEVIEVSKIAQISITFICHDPFKYGQIKTFDRKQEIIMVNEGTAETYPIIKLKPSFDTTRLVIKNYSNLTPYETPKEISLGYPQSPAQEEVDPIELVMHDTMQSTSSWQTATEIDNGHIAGEMGVNRHGFYASLFGQPVDYTKWQGPSLIKGIGTSLQDFRADIYVRNFNVGKDGTGMIEVYFRDANGNRVAKIGIEDLYTNSEEIQGKARIGTGSNYHDIYTKPDYPEGWNNFDGLLRIDREDDAWRPYFAQIINGKHNWVRGTLKYVDVRETATAPITHVQVAIRKFPAPDETEMAIKEIKIYKINQITNPETQVPKSFKKDDEVEINCGTGLVTVNGEQRMDLIDLNTEFFSLVPGVNNVDANFPFTATWQERFL